MPLPEWWMFQKVLHAKMTFLRKIWPFTRKIWPFLRQNDGPIKLVFGVIAAGYVLAQYLDHNQEMKLTRSLDYITISIEPHVLKDRVSTGLLTSTDGPVAPLVNNPKIYAPNADCGQLSKCEIKPEIRDEIDKVIDKQGVLKYQIRDLLNVYYNMATCATSDLCNERVLCRAFFSEVQRYYLYYAHLKTIIGDYWNSGKVHRIGLFLDKCDHDVPSTLSED